MASSWRLDWRGAALKAAMRKAREQGEREALEAAAERARGLAPVRTGAYRDSIHVENIVSDEDSTHGELVADAPHSIFVDIGSRGRPGHNVLRRAADSEFGSLSGRIKAGL